MRYRFIRYRLEPESAVPCAEELLDIDDALLAVKTFPIKEEMKSKGLCKSCFDPMVSIRASDRDFIRVMFCANGSYEFNMFYKIGTYQQFAMNLQEIESLVEAFYINNHRRLFIKLARGRQGTVIVGSGLRVKVLSFLWGLRNA